ncbi:MULTISPECIES: phage terminase large subunit family protein [Halapricum]|uniref:Zn finger protein, C2C2 type n=2 Tax=Halapricum TaxID=1542963 RepID=A0A897NHJ5_9EURY|nr:MULTISPECIES: phage terminase large subunit family protein [Halapricum]MCU4716602.1 phage terminase large subunit family protein [Halapricum hydrolyticum]MCU4725793.1 phage terminase large subunit family protein [Halapricum hydrolyticum]QSG11811.1 Zn finger protein, C2C2 type [Halapricum desulfuricans]
MTPDESYLGRCPECGEDISEAWLLVKYTKDNGETGIWAECPNCEDVVAPE